MSPFDVSHEYENYKLLNEMPLTFTSESDRNILRLDYNWHTKIKLSLIWFMGAG